MQKNNGYRYIQRRFVTNRISNFQYSLSFAAISVAIFLLLFTGCSAKIDEAQLPEYLDRYNEQALNADIDEASKTLDVMIRSFPNDPQYMVEAIGLYVLQGDYNEARKMCDRILKNFPANTHAREWLETLESLEDE